MFSYTYCLGFGSGALSDMTHSKFLIENFILVDLYRIISNFVSCSYAPSAEPNWQGHTCLGLAWLGGEPWGKVHGPQSMAPFFWTFNFTLRLDLYDFTRENYPQRVLAKLNVFERCFVSCTVKDPNGTNAHSSFTNKHLLNRTYFQNTRVLLVLREMYCLLLA